MADAQLGAPDERVATVTLIAALDNVTLHVARADACVCTTIAHALESSASDDETAIIPLNVASAMLRQVLTASRGAAHEIAAHLDDSGADELQLFCAASYLEAHRLLQVIHARLSARLSAALSLDRTPLSSSGPRREERLAALRDFFGIPLDLTPEAAAASAAESPLTLADEPAASSAEQTCRLGALPGGEDLLEELLARCGRTILSQCKALSVGWRRTARRVMGRPAWQAAFLGLGELVEVGAPPEVILARLRRSEGVAEAARKEPTSRRLPLHLLAMRASEAADKHGGAFVERTWGGVFEAMLAAHVKAAEARDLEGFTPMHYAAHGSLPPRVLRRLLEAYPIVPWQKVWKVMVLPRGGGSLNLLQGAEAVHLGRLPLHLCAAGKAELAALDFLLDAYAPAAKEVDAAGRTPLHLLCLGGAPEASIVRLLEAHRDAAGVKDREGKTPLELALESRPGEIGVLRLLADASGPDGASRMLNFFMERLKLGPEQVVQLAQGMAQAQAKQQQQRPAP